ncbi:factor activating pos9 [Rhizoctonia solani]
MSDTDERPLRKYPIIVITGTPGTGKSTHAELVASQSSIPLRHVNVGDLVKEKGLHEGFDEEWQSYIVDEDKIQENNTSEIMQTVLDEAKSSYAEEIIVELKSENTEDLEANVSRICTWVDSWMKDHGGDS